MTDLEDRVKELERMVGIIAKYLDGHLDEHSRIAKKIQRWKAATDEEKVQILKDEGLQR